MSRSHGAGVYSGAQQEVRQNPDKRALIHALPDPTDGPWERSELDEDVTRGEIRWLRSTGLIHKVTHTKSNAGNTWRSTNDVPTLKNRYDAPACGSGGILDCGGNRFRSTSNGLVCKHCEGVTSRENARARKNGGEP